MSEHAPVPIRAARASDAAVIARFNRAMALETEHRKLSPPRVLRGVFKALHAHIERMARQRKDVCGVRLYVDDHNTKAKEVYARLGLKPTHYELWETDFVLRPPPG